MVKVLPKDGYCKILQIAYTCNYSGMKHPFSRNILACFLCLLRVSPKIPIFVKQMIRPLSNRQSSSSGIRGVLYGCSIVLIHLFFPGVKAAAQVLRPFDLKQPQPAYTNFSTERGLPSSETYDIHQDKKGYIWIATDRGVTRYDGYRFTVFTKKDGLADNVIFKLVEDRHGRIWFVSFSGMLSYFENGKIVPYKYNYKIRKFMGRAYSATYKTLVFDEADNLYYAIQRLGSMKITPSGELTNYHPKGLNGMIVKKIGDKVFPSVSDYPVALTGRFPCYMETFSRKGYAGVYRIGALVNASTDGTHSFVCMDDTILDVNSGKFLLGEFSAIGIDCIDNQLFTGIYKGGVRLDNLLLGEKHPLRVTYLLEGKSVSSVMKDREGGYWFTTLENGVYYTPDLNVRSYGVREGLPNPNILQLAGIDTRVVGCFANGLVQFSDPSGITVFGPLKYNPMIAASRKRFYVTWDQPLKVMVKEDFVFLTTCSDIYAYQDHALYPQTSVKKADDNGFISDVLIYQRDQTVFQAVVETGSGKVYGGELSGLYKVFLDRIVPVKPSDPLFSERVTDLAWHKKLGVVVATRGKGIYFMDDHEKLIRKIDMKDGLLNDQVNCLFIDNNGLVYVGTNSGFNVIKISSGNKIEIRSFTTSHGLCSNEINSIYAYGGKIWVATKKGLSVLHADRTLLRNGKVFVEYLAADNRYFEKGAFPAHFSPSTGFIKIGFRTDNFRGSNKHQFKYQVRENGPWIFTGQPELVINDPSHDDYRISLRFKNDEGRWSDAVLLATFTVDAPFYKEWYFIVLVFIGAMILMYWLFRVILKRVKSRHYYETRINKLEQKALSAQMNPHFIFNSLNSIQSFLIYEENEKAEKYLLKFSSLIRQTLANSREHYIRMEQELSILHNYLELEQMRFKDRFSFEIQSNLTPAQMQQFIPPMLVQPYVENAVLHGMASVKSGGKITITFHVSEEDRLRVTIDDNGAGRTKGARPKGGQRSFGTTITQERLDILKKQLGVEFKVTITDKKDENGPLGTRIDLHIRMISHYVSEDNQSGSAG